MEERAMVRRRGGGDTEEVLIDVEGVAGGGFRHRRPPVNSLSAREMESLTAISDAFLPSIHLPGTHNDSLHHFFRLSASMAGTPHIAGAYLSGRVQHVMLWLLRLALWSLSTWYGTFVLCGRRSLSRSFPYFLKLSQVPQRRREEILLAWSNSSILYIRLLFKAVKLIVLLTYFTQVEEKNENPTWKAIGYCGPDPDFVAHLRKPPEPAQKIKREGDDSNPVEDVLNRFGPLHRALVHPDRPRPAVSAALARAGLSLSLSHSASHRRRAVPTIRCDAVVVGSGSGGGVVAGVLARAGYKVVVVERGRHNARHGLTLLEGHSMDNMYESAGLRTTDDMGVLVLAGSGVGGGSAVNWSASIRTPQHVMEEWCDVHGLELFGSRAYREALDAVCARMGVQTEVSDEGFNNAVLRRGCGELGYPVQTIPRNAGADHYCGWCCFGCKDGKKKGTSETWLVDMAESGNGVVLPRCTAVKVLQDRRQLHCGRRPVATGVLVQFDGDEEEEGGSGKQQGGGEMWVVEAKVTVVACGALRTPELLLRSGLRNPNIGRHLHLHPVVMAWGHFPRERASRWPEVEKRSYEGGIMTAMSTVVANFKSGSGYGAIIQTPALHPGMFSVLTPWTSGADIKERMTRFSRTAHIFALARDRGCGDVRAYPGSLRYHLDGEDEEHLQRGMEKMLRILAAAGAEEIGTQHRAGRRLNVKTASSHEFERFVRRESRRGLRKDLPTPICSAHQMGSCRMGLAPGTSAVDPRGETWEVEGLYVADTSTFPTALGVNPMVTVQAIAYCTAQSILHLLSRTKKKNTTTTATHR